jgi:hypothetical protein
MIMMYYVESFTTNIEGTFRSSTSNDSHENFKSISEDMQQGVESS